jgi:predicted permease
VAYVNGLPLESQGDLLFSIVGRGDAEVRDADIRVASPGYFGALGIPVVRGRAFTSGDAANAEPVVVINRTMAETFWPGQDPIGEHIWIGKPMGPASTERAPRRIVGIVGDVRGESLAIPPQPAMFEPYAQVTQTGSANFVVRTAQEPQLLEPAVRAALRSALPDQPAGAVRTMDQIVARSLRTQRFQTVLLALFAGMALLIATVGVYGVISYAVSQRTHEFGVRVALGATPGNVRRMILAQGLRLTLIGIVLGQTASFALSGFVRSLLYGVAPSDPAILAGVTLLLVAVAAAACWVPARRATRADPMIALRCE